MGCPIPGMKILLSDGSSKLIEEIKVGDEVDTLHEKTLKRGQHKVTEIEEVKTELLSLNFSGQIFKCAPTHQFHFADKKEWVKAKDLTQGDKVLLLEGEKEFTELEEIEKGTGIHLTVDEAHTFICDGILSHNKGNTTVEAPEPPEKDDSFEKYMNYQSKRDDQRGYETWLGDVQDYESKKIKQKAGRANWNTFQQNVKDRVSTGLIDYDQAAAQLKDYANTNFLASGSIQRPGDDPRKMWRESVEDDPDTEKDETFVGWRPDEFREVPTYDTPDEWKEWSLVSNESTLDNWYQTEILPEQRKGKITRAYQAVLGRDATEDEMTDTLDYFNRDPGYSAQTLRGDLQIGNEYREKFNKSYQDTYFDSMYGEGWNETFKDDQGEDRNKTVRKFNLQTGLSPSFSDDSNLKNDMGIDWGDTPTSFTGSAAEIEFGISQLRDKEKALYTAGIKNLEGNIQKDLQKLQNKSREKIAKIDQTTSMMGLLGHAFS